jgi:hypothetical protein
MKRMSETASDKWGAGSPEKWSDHGTVMVGKQEFRLIWGEHPHSRSDNNHYVVFNEEREPVGFAGHRILIDVRVSSSNYTKESYYSGDEVRKGGSCEIIADGVVVYEFFHRDPRWALRKADSLIGQLSEHPSCWMSKRDREQLVGRKVFYDRTPAIITSLIADQGCVMLSTEDGKPFPPPVWAKADMDHEREATIKDDVLSPRIWWFRD